MSNVFASEPVSDEPLSVDLTADARPDALLSDATPSSDSGASGDVLGADESAPETDSPPAGSTLVSEILAEKERLRSALARTVEEFAAYRTRSEQRNVTAARLAKESLLSDLLPALDSFELALASFSTEQDPSSWARGVELAFATLETALASHGLERISADGQLFDPEQHHAVSHAAGTGASRVANTLRSGWQVDKRVVRPALVHVQDDAEPASSTNDLFGGDRP